MKVFILLLSLLLTGCASQKFDCPYKDGVRCMSLGEVDKQISAGKIGTDKKVKKEPVVPLETIALPLSPLRTPEEVLTVWVAPYQTTDGTYFEEKTMHFVVKPAEWVNTVNEILLEENHGSS